MTNETAPRAHVVGHAHDMKLCAPHASCVAPNKSERNALVTKWYMFEYLVHRPRSHLRMTRDLRVLTGFRHIFRRRELGMISPRRNLAPDRPACSDERTTPTHAPTPVYEIADGDASTPHCDNPIPRSIYVLSSYSIRSHSISRFRTRRP